MEPSTKFGGSWWLKEPWLTRQLCKVGMGRCEFFLHGGTVSLGCITVNKMDPIAMEQWDNLKKLLNRESTNRMVVVP